MLQCRLLQADTYILEDEPFHVEFQQSHVLKAIEVTKLYKRS